MSISNETLACAQTYTDESLAGAGAVAGVPCQIQSIAAITGGNRVTFLWLDNNGVSHTSTMDVMNGQRGETGATGQTGAAGADGKDGVGIKSMVINSLNHLIITYTDDNSSDAGEIPNVQADWNESDSSADSFIKNKPSLGTAASKNIANEIEADNHDLPDSDLVHGAVAAKQDKTLASPISVGGVSQTTVEGALGAVNDQVGSWDESVTEKAYAPVINLSDALGVNAKDIKVKLEPVQAGSGTPSRSNVRAISGWDKIEISRKGKNLIDQVILGYIDTNNNKYIIDSNSTSIVFFAKAGKTYTVSAGIGLTRSIIAHAVDNSLTNQEALLYSENLGEDVRTWTSPWDGWTIWYIYNGISETLDNTAQVEFGDEATEYEAYNPDLYVINLNGTRYGGVLDVTTGTLAIDRKIVDLDSFTWYKKNTKSTWRFETTLSDIKHPASSNDPLNGICSCYAPISANDSWNDVIGIASQPNVLLICDTTLSTVEDLITAMAGQTLCYELATPVTYYLSGKVIQLLQGVNNVYANSGDISLDYLTPSIGNLCGAVADLSEQVNEFELKSGNGVINDTYFDTDSSYTCKWTKYGRLVKINFRAKVKTQIPSANVELASGFPPAISGDVIGFATTAPVGGSAVDFLGQVRMQGTNQTSIGYPFNGVVPVDTYLDIKLSYFAQLT